MKKKYITAGLALLFAAMAAIGGETLAAQSALVGVKVKALGCGGTVVMEEIVEHGEPGVYSVEVDSDSSALILISETMPGTSLYRIYMESLSDEGFVMDDTVYTGSLYIELTDNDLLAGTFVLDGEEGAKGADIVFDNVPIAGSDDNSSGGSGGSGDSSGGSGSGSSGGSSSGSSGSGGSSSGSSGSGGTGRGSVSVTGTSGQAYERPTAVSPTVSSGSWELIDASEHVWKFRLSSGSYAAGGFYYIANSYSHSGRDYDWFCFDEDGLMQYGWWRPSDSPREWYFFHDSSDGDLGAMTTGWHFSDEDERWYYLSPTDGVMATGWQTIDGYEYYFERYEDVPFATWVSKKSGILKWIYDKIGIRSYGSMYMGETTPDGSKVDSQGRRIGWT